LRTSCPNRIPVISKLALVLDIYSSLSLIWRYSYCPVFQGATSFTSAETPKEKVFLRNNDGILAYQNGLPVRGKQMSVTIKIIPVINDDQLRGISDNTELESALAWELLTTE
ncbi:hypothetical protein ABK735_12295, partial [Enterobacter kobei]